MPDDLGKLEEEVKASLRAYADRQLAEGCHLIRLVSCARRGKNHQRVLFYPFTQPPPSHTHWGTCPNTGEPILMKISFCL